MSSRSSAASRACAAGLAAALLAMPLVACSHTDATAEGVSASSEQVQSSTAKVVATDPTIDHLINAADLVSERDLDSSWEENEATKIQLSDAGCSVFGSGAAADGSTVTISAAGTYVVSGTLSEGQLVVDAGDEKVQIVLSDAHVTCAESAALLVRSAGKVWVTLAEGTSNGVATTGSYAQDATLSIDGALWCKSDLTINGSGALTVSSAQGHGVVCKDELVLVSGEVSVEAARSAVQAKDSVCVVGGSWELSAGTDGVHCGDDDDADKGDVVIAGGELGIDASSDGIDAGNRLEVDGGTLSVSADDDGLHAERALQVDGGVIDVTGSYEGLEGATVTMNAGEVSVVSTDDGVNASGDPDASDASTTEASGGELADAAGQPGAGDGGLMFGGGKQPAQDGFGNGGMDYDSTARVTINGGRLTICASGDGIDSNGDLEVTGGETYVFGPTSDGDGSLDYGGTAAITGGVVLCAGSSGMAQGFGDSSTQVSVMVSAEGFEGDSITLADADGTVLAQTSALCGYSCIIVSAPGIETGQTYTLTCGDSSSEITPDSVSYSNVSRAAGGAQPGGQPGGDQGNGGGPGGGGPGGGQPGGGEQGNGPGGDSGAVSS
ncbi:carbohydrate-binding domain-containing protein [Paratractidigestivibacter sp.]|uniref:carbohydrate-binding domain-containing protein n=1 Tax=Paratractidigestivibacter sp. TaxID=2847316 RepID=UPI002ABE6DB5|nr:carbohydrate-binding domain-containing protein [Paratractidigestivibacter sp.]